MSDHWRVEVKREGETIVAIEPEMLAGRDLSEEDLEVIRKAGRALLGFAGESDDGGFLPEEVETGWMGSLS